VNKTIKREQKRGKRERKGLVLSAAPPNNTKKAKKITNTNPGNYSP
jgi:hypothetical protein